MSIPKLLRLQLNHSLLRPQLVASIFRTCLNSSPLEANNSPPLRHNLSPHLSRPLCQTSSVLSTFFDSSRASRKHPQHRKSPLASRKRRRILTSRRFSMSCSKCSRLQPSLRLLKRSLEWHLILAPCSGSNLVARTSHPTPLARLTKTPTANACARVVNQMSGVDRSGPRLLTPSHLKLDWYRASSGLMGRAERAQIAHTATALSPSGCPFDQVFLVIPADTSLHLLFTFTRPSARPFPYYHISSLLSC